MTYFFTSDYHFGHNNIIKYCNRPFKNIEEMNNTIITNHNSIVKDTDTVFFLGDFCFGNPEDYISKLNGNFVFIRGNHDHKNSIQTCIDGVIIDLGGKNFYLTHRPEDYEPNIKYNIVGHVHQAWKTKILKKGNVLINVGVDVNNFYPITINDILKQINTNLINH